MNDENSPEQTNSSEAPQGKKEQIDSQGITSALQPDEEKKQELQDSFERVHKRSDKFSHEWDLKREAKKLDMEVDEYRRWYELRPKPRTWFYQIFHPIRVIWHCTGFGEKKLWDILQLLIVSVFLAGGAFYLQDTAKKREEVVAIENKKREEFLAIDKANQDTLVKYLDQMAELLQKGLLKTKPNFETFIIAQAKTVIALQSLDPKRQHLVIQFLAAATLNTLLEEKGILYQAQMSKANLNKADFSFAHLNKANLSEAKLSEAKLLGAKLSRADLSKADLNGAELSGADLNGANLSGAKLSDAKTLSEVQLQLLLAQAKLCNTTLPNGRVSNRDCGK